MKLLGAAVAAIVFVSACGSGAMEKELAAVAFPPSWEQVKATSKNDCFPLGDPHCPSATEYFATPPDLLAVYQTAREAVAAQGYEIRDFTPRCEGVPDLPPCAFSAHKNGFTLELNVYAPGTDVDALGVARADQATIRVIVAPG